MEDGRENKVNTTHVPNLGSLRSAHSTQPAAMGAAIPQGICLHEGLHRAGSPAGRLRSPTAVALRQLDAQHDLVDARGQRVQRPVLTQPEAARCLVTPQHHAVCGSIPLTLLIQADSQGKPAWCSLLCACLSSSIWAAAKQTCGEGLPQPGNGGLGGFPGRAALELQRCDDLAACSLQAQLRVCGLRRLPPPHRHLGGIPFCSPRKGCFHACSHARAGKAGMRCSMGTMPAGGAHTIPRLEGCRHTCCQHTAPWSCSPACCNVPG